MSHLHNLDPVYLAVGMLTVLLGLSIVLNLFGR